MLQLVCDIQLCRSRLFDSARGEWEVQFVHTKIIQTHKKKQLRVTFCAISAMTTFRTGPGWMCAWASMRRSTWKIWWVKKSRYRLACTLIFTVCAVWPLLFVEKSVFFVKVNFLLCFFLPCAITKKNVSVRNAHTKVSYYSPRKVKFEVTHFGSATTRRCHWHFNERHT